jgi:hypothetical protein
VEAEKLRTTALLMAVLVGAAALAQQAGQPVPVTVDNFTRAESDLYFGNAVREAGGIGRLLHHREMSPVDNQIVIRTNRDTLYSSGVFDLEAGPVTITLPDAGKRFRSLMVVNEDHYIVGDVQYEAGTYTYDQARAGTRYVLVALRTFANPNDPKDLAAVRALQDATRVAQKASGKFEVPAWDPVSQKRIRDALLVLGSTTGKFTGAFGSKREVDPVYHLIGSAVGWGGNPEKDAVYRGENPPRNDGNTVHRLTVSDVPVDGFWSVSVYDAKGYFQKNTLNAYSLNNITAKKSADGAYTIQFGGCDGKVPNCLPIMPGWNYTVRLYRPRAAILDESWQFPMAEPVR